MVTDEKEAGSDGKIVPLKEGVQSVVIDPESRHNTYAVLVWHYVKEPRACAAVVVQVADAPDFIANVTTLFNNDRTNAAGLGIGTDLHVEGGIFGRLLK